MLLIMITPLTFIAVVLPSCRGIIGAEAETSAAIWFRIAPLPSLRQRSLAEYQQLSRLDAGPGLVVGERQRRDHSDPVGRRGEPVEVDFVILLDQMARG